MFLKKRDPERSRVEAAPMGVNSGISYPKRTQRH